MTFMTVMRRKMITSVLASASKALQYGHTLVNRRALPVKMVTMMMAVYRCL